MLGAGWLIGGCWPLKKDFQWWVLANNKINEGFIYKF
jgi:hypothetical protein